MTERWFNAASRKDASRRWRRAVLVKPRTLRDVYGGKGLDRATECARSLRFGGAGQGPAGVARALTRLPALLCYLRRLPRVEVRLSDDPAGLAIAEHLALRRWGLPRFRIAQGILLLAPDFASYLRGRRRQALRTNIHRAREQGFVCHSETVAAWRREEPGLTTTAPAEHWWVTDADGRIAGEAYLTIDRECALLHYLTCRESYVRWLLHAAIVERLCLSGQSLLITNSFDVPLLTPGLQHFQHLLGYSVARLRPRAVVPRRAPAAESVPVPRLAGLAAIAAAAIVGQQLLTSPIELAGERALVWLTALVAVRVAAGRVGWSALAGAGAAMTIAVLQGALVVSLAYFLCGIVLDLELAAVSRFGQSRTTMPFVGATAVFVAAIAPAFPTLGHHDPGDAWTIPPIVGAVVFGALAAVLGHQVGQHLRRLTSRTS